MIPHIGWYVNSHGAGHVHRFLTCVHHLKAPVVLFMDQALSVPERLPESVTVVKLPPYPAAVGSTHLRGYSFHHAPTSCPSMLARRFAFMQNLKRYQVVLMVVDVSVEVAAFSTLCGIDTIYVKLPGKRYDLAHRTAFAYTKKIIAPYPKSWDWYPFEDAFQHKVEYFPLCSRLSPPPSTQPAGAIPPPKNIVVMIGNGNSAITGYDIDRIAASQPSHITYVLGRLIDQDRPTDSRAHYLGFVSDPVKYLSNAEVVISSAGQNSVAELGALRRRAVLVPETRPFDEQAATVQAAQRCNVAISGSWTFSAQQWIEAIEQARRIDVDRWKPFVSSNSGQRIAHAIMQTYIEVQNRCATRGAR